MFLYTPEALTRPSSVHVSNMTMHLYFQARMSDESQLAPTPQTVIYKMEKAQQGLTCKRFSGVSNSLTRPSSSTRILSESKMLCSRCAMVSTVQSAKAALTVSCMRASLAVSTLLVASSRTRTLALRRRARAMHSSCLWPELRLLPASPSTASNPPYKREVNVSKGHHSSTASKPPYKREVNVSKGYHSSSSCNHR